MNNGRLTLSIESAVGGGSIALLRAGEMVAHRSEGNDSSRAEKLLSTIDDLLSEAGVAMRDLEVIAVSIGPGSYSGIRIGVSTALGLSRALGIECVGVSVLDAMAHANDIHRDFIAAIPVGKNDIAWQYFSEVADGEKTTTGPELLPVPEFIDVFSRDYTGTDLLAHVDLVPRLDGKIPSSIRLRTVGPGMAEFVGKLALSEHRLPAPLHPIYLRNSRAPKSAAF